jgi:hypothetical protein
MTEILCLVGWLFLFRLFSSLLDLYFLTIFP